MDDPIRNERYSFVPDRLDAGRFRGGLSILREYRVLTNDVSLGVRSDKRRFPPHGLNGGGPGAPSINVINPDDGHPRVLPTQTIDPVALGEGDVFRHVTAGVGGHGDKAPTSRHAAMNSGHGRAS